ncbi:copper resistance protein CopC [Kineosporia sp. J2-2]|uniref:Copper resistance protein CopC n=1 Tax=Kineosporia corallincola TaxID=2835133 RepID=A0ABS5TFS4_9ACTN|nr:copper resistance CopC family protein [Kineosporia corallincola]MBT0769703.1 copper resistance protein CopC [Kineosporia corallincola]
MIGRTAGRFAAALALMASGLLLGAGPALAHDQLDSTNPEDGSTVKKLPGEIELDFNNVPLALGSVLKVVGPDGDVTDGKPEVVDHVVTQPIKPGPAGDYTVQWRVTSSDGHPISGEFAFTAEAGNQVEATSEASASPDVSAVATGEAETGSATTASAATGDNSDQDESGGTSPVLVITLIVLAVVVLGAVVYLFVLAPKRSNES